MNPTNRRKLLIAGFAALLSAAPGPRAAIAQNPCPSYPDRPSLGMTILWRNYSSNRTYPAFGALVEVFNRAGHRVRWGYADSRGKVYFGRLPVGMHVRVQSTYRGRVVHATDRYGQIVWLPNNRCDGRSGGILHFF